MVDLAEAAPANVEPSGRRHRRWRWVVAASIVLLLAGGTITAFAVSSRYRHAPALSVVGGGWITPTGDVLRDVQAGPYDALVAPLMPGRWETFEVDVINWSDVTQTMLGLTDAKTAGDPRMRAEPERLTMAAGEHNPSARFGTKPVTLKPHGSAMVELSILASKEYATPCSGQWWQALSLRVRVGAFTRTEDVQFGELIMELQYPGACS